MFDSELVLAQVPEQPNHVEIIWEESREHWLERLLPLVPVRKID